jgi:hypothetical protein
MRAAAKRFAAKAAKPRKAGRASDRAGITEVAAKRALKWRIARALRTKTTVSLSSISISLSSSLLLEIRCQTLADHSLIVL